MWPCDNKPDCVINFDSFGMPAAQSYQRERYGDIKEIALFIPGLSRLYGPAAIHKNIK